MAQVYIIYSYNINLWLNFIRILHNEYLILSYTYFMSVSPGLALPNIPKKNDGHIDIYIYCIFVFYNIINT